VLQIVVHEVRAPKIPSIRKEIFCAAVVEVGDSSKGYKVETGGNDFVSEDVGGQNCNVMTGAAEMLGNG
jgi:hypothetical protein